MAHSVETVVVQWTRLGVLFNVEPAEQVPDLERLLLDTARVVSTNSRLFILAATWVARHAELVSTSRLATLIHNELEPEHRPTLGLLLESASREGKELHAAIEACGSAIDSRPLFDIERQNPVFARFAEPKASALSRKWGRWMAPFEFRSSALRPRQWVLLNVQTPASPRSRD